jgi:hypothetical protein
LDNSKTPEEYMALYDAARELRQRSIEVRIAYPSYTWMLDISNLINTFISSLIIPVSDKKAGSFLDKLSENLRDFILVVALLLSVLWVRFNIANLMIAYFFPENPTELDLLLGIRDYILWLPFTLDVVFIIISIIIVIAVAAMVRKLLIPARYPPQPSYILFSDENEKYKNDVENIMQKVDRYKNQRTLWNFAVSVASGVVSTALWVHFFSQ